MNNTVTPSKATYVGSEKWAKWLHRELKERHINYSTLGKAIGYDRKAILAYAKNYRSPRLETVIAIMDYLGYDCVNIKFK